MVECCSNNKLAGVSSILIVCLMILFNQLVCIPLLSTGTGTLDLHIHACAGVGENPPDYKNDMDGPLKSAVRMYEQHEAEMVLMNFYTAASFSIVAHGLTMMAMFGTSLPSLASYAGGDEGKTNPLRKTLVSLGSLFTLGFGYFIILIVPIGSLPYLSGESGGEWTKNPDFGLDTGTCWTSNPWFESFLDDITNSGVAILVILQLITIITIGINSFAFMEKGE